VHRAPQYLQLESCRSRSASIIRAAIIYRPAVSLLVNGSPAELLNGACQQQPRPRGRKKNESHFRLKAEVFKPVIRQFSFSLNAFSLQT